MSLKLFYCYAREDKSLREALGIRLGNLKRQELIVDWYDRNINAGQEWRKEIDTNLDEADILLLLISPDFVHSDYCYSNEMKRALERHENGTATVIPIILRHGDYEGAPFRKLQALPTDGVPITDRKWHNRDEAFFNVVQGIRKTVGVLVSNERVSKGNEHLLREQYKEALDAFEQAIFFNPDNTLAYIGKGQTLLDHNSVGLIDSRYQKALDAFTQAIKLNPLNADAYVGKATALYFADNPFDFNQDLVLETYAQALSLNPKNENAYIKQGNAHFYYKNYKEALTSYEQAISVAAILNRSVYRCKGDTLFHLERYEEAIEAYEICIKAGLKNVDIYRSIGKALFSLNKYREALVAYNKALALNANDGIVYLGKGEVLYQLGMYNEALDAYEKAISLFPNYENLLIAQAFKSKGNILQLLSQQALEKAKELESELGELEELF